MNFPKRWSAEKPAPPPASADPRCDRRNRHLQRPRPVVSAKVGQPRRDRMGFPVIKFIKRRIDSTPVVPNGKCRRHCHIQARDRCRSVVETLQVVREKHLNTRTHLCRRKRHIPPSRTSGHASLLPSYTANSSCGHAIIFRIPAFVNPFSPIVCERLDPPPTM